MRRTILALVLLLLPAAMRAQALSLAAATASGDCTGTSFHQSADASGKYIAAEWAVPGQFALGINRGRSRCTIRYTVTLPVGYKFQPGGMSGNANRMILGQVSHLRLSGSVTGVLVESAVSIDMGTPLTISAMANGGAMNGTNLALERPSSSPIFESACATAAKTSFQWTTVLDAAAASNYVVPWPPEPYAQREMASMAGARMFYTLVPCAPTRTAVPAQGATLRP